MDDLSLQRLLRESEELERREARALELAAQRKLYRDANGRDPETYEALAVWAGAHLGGRSVDPYGVLDRAEIAQVWEDAEDLVR